jgi:2-polyprenyl-6-methoxyphenol hydroxylase-like FAD-dependent oxidoreductase
MDDKTVLISGAGIAGPTLAYWLLEWGWRPTLVERSPRLRGGGYVIDFWGTGFDIAERMGLVPGLRREGYDIQELRVVDAEGRRVGGFDASVFRRLTGERYVSIRRGDLARLIFGTVESRCQTIFGDSITRIDQEPDSVRVAFERAAERRFALVVGADGLHSNVRGLVFGPQDRFEKYLGYMVAAFATPDYRPRNENLYIAYSVPGKTVARFAMHGSRTMFLFVFAAPDPAAFNLQDIGAQKAVLQREYADAGWECPRILAALDRCRSLYFDRVSQIRTDAWSQGRVTLIGDAAFCPSLLAGQGSALAMIAAYVLAGELAEAPTPQEGLRRYEERLRTFMTAKQRAAASFATAFAPKTRFGIFVRNQISKLFAVPFIADTVMGTSLRDRLDLPRYDPLRRAVPQDAP